MCVDASEPLFSVKKAIVSFVLIIMSLAAVSVMHGRSFDGRTVAASLFPENRWEMDDLQYRPELES